MALLLPEATAAAAAPRVSPLSVLLAPAWLMAWLPPPRPVVELPALLLTRAVPALGTGTATGFCFFQVCLNVELTLA